MEKRNLTPGMQLLLLVLMTLFSVFFAQILGAFILIAIYGEQIPDMENINPVVTTVLLLISNFCMHILTFFMFIRMLRLSFSQVFPKTPGKWIIWLALPVIAVISIPLMDWITTASFHFFEYNGFYQIIEEETVRQQALEPILIHQNPGQLVLSLLAFAVVPAIGEELIYRGLLISRLIQSTGNIHFSVIISALIFAAVHWQPLNLLSITLMGIVLGYLYVRTRNIWYGILLHFLINAIQIIQLYVWPELLEQI